MILSRKEAVESKFEFAIGTLLIVGVVSSLLLEGIGIALFYFSYGQVSISESRGMFIHGENFFNFFCRLLEGEYRKNTGVLLMTLGIAILILTPYARVAISVFYFAWQKNVKYVFITLFVFILLTISLTVS